MKSSNFVLALVVIPIVKDLKPIAMLYRFHEGPIIELIL